MKRQRSRPRLAPILDRLDDRCLLSGLTPSEIAGAYGLSGIQFLSPGGQTVTANGAGQTIALIEAYHDPTVASDLHQFDLAFHLPDPSLQVVDLAGTNYNAGWAGEESLDVEWAHALAPAANILVVEAASQNLNDLMNAVLSARNDPAVTVISMSWGFSEIPNETNYDSFFTTPAGHQGITFVAASGDNGTVEYPSSSPNVLAVGGTTLTLSPTGGYGGETAWYATGGGFSLYEAEPTYQAAIQTTGRRSTPDVAFNADPASGAAVYQTVNGQATWQAVGGTSLGAPAWAALVALVDQGRAAAGRGSLDGPTQTLPALYSAPASAFHAVAALTGMGGFPIGVFDPFGPSGGQGGLFAPLGGSVVASSGANTATGLGSPVGAALFADLSATTLVTPLGTVSGSAPDSLPPTSPITISHQKHHGPIRRLGHGRPIHKTPKLGHRHARVAHHKRALPRQGARRLDAQLAVDVASWWMRGYDLAARPDASAGASALSATHEGPKPLVLEDRGHSAAPGARPLRHGRLKPLVLEDRGLTPPARHEELALASP